MIKYTVDGIEHIDHFSILYKIYKKELIHYVVSHNLMNVRGFSAVARDLDKYHGSVVQNNLKKNW